MARKTPKKSPRVMSASSSFKDTKMLWVLIVIVALVIGFGVFYVMNSLTKQDTYYVLQESIPSRTQITPDLLATISTSPDSIPPNALDVTDVQMGNVYSKYPLNAGDVVSESNSGPLDSVNEGVPDNWVVTSFDPGDSDPVVENLARGDYFDIMVVNMKKSDATSGEEVAKDDRNQVLDNITIGQWLFRNVMVLDNPTATVSSDSADSENGATAQTQNSTTMFLLGMSPRNATILAMAESQYDLKLVISPQYNAYRNPSDLDALYTQFDFGAVISKNPSGIIASNCVDLKQGDDETDDEYKERAADGYEVKKNCTDNTFSITERDKFGVPYNWVEGVDKDRDENGDVVPLTQYEITWCKLLFDDEYYSNEKWDDMREYCGSHDDLFKHLSSLITKAKSVNNGIDHIAGTTAEDRANAKAAVNEIRDMSKAKAYEAYANNDLDTVSKVADDGITAMNSINDVIKGGSGTNGADVSAHESKYAEIVESIGGSVELNTDDSASTESDTNTGADTDTGTGVDTDTDTNADTDTDTDIE